MGAQNGQINVEAAVVKGPTCAISDRTVAEMEEKQTWAHLF